MTERSIVICGFPESGKTTYLAALWHLVTARTDAITLRFQSLNSGDNSHLNTIARRWVDGLTQMHTEISNNQLVSMNLVDDAERPLRLTFPDLSGESYRQMFEERECEPSVAEILSNGKGMLFFVHADRIRQPQLVTTMMAQSQALGTPIPPNQYVSWSPRLAPTGIQIVELLQLLRLKPLNVSFRRMAIVLSAWDKVADEGRTPKEFLAERLPLLDQYLESAADEWEWRVYGVSAQGADYEKENETLNAAQTARLEQIRSLDEPATRIKVVFKETESHDLTEPISWLMS